MQDRILEIVNLILEKENKKPLEKFFPECSLRSDLEMDSFDLAELTVRIEDEFDVDIFEDGIVETLEDIILKLERK